MKISSFITQARQRFQAQDPYVRWSDTQHLLGKIDKPQEGSWSLASSASDISSSMRECIDGITRLGDGSDIQILPDLGRFREQLMDLYIEANLKLSDSNAPQYSGLSEMMVLLKADKDPGIEKLLVISMKLPSLLSNSSRFYQQEGRSRTLQVDALSILERLTETTRNLLKSYRSSSPIVDIIRLSHAKSSSSKAWLQYQLGDSTCLATLNNARNILMSSDGLNRSPKFLAQKSEALSVINTWLAIFQLDEKFCPKDSLIRPVRVAESLKLIQESLPLIESARDYYLKEGSLAFESRTAFEILIADTMFKINHLLAEQGASSGSFTTKQLIEAVEPLYDFDTGIVKKQVTYDDLIGLAYILTLVDKNLKTDNFNESLDKTINASLLLRLQGRITNVLEKNGTTSSSVGLSENKKAMAKYTKELFGSMNQGNSHWMSVVACSRDPLFQFNEMMPTIDRNEAKAMF